GLLEARAAVAAGGLERPTTRWPVRASPRRKTGVTELDGRFQLAPLGKVDTRHCSLIRFVHTTELVCNQGLERAQLRKHCAVRGLTSYQRSYLLGLSSASIAEPGQGRAVSRITQGVTY